MKLAILLAIIALAGPTTQRSTFTERSPHSDPHELVRRLDIKAPSGPFRPEKLAEMADAMAAKMQYDINDFAFDVVVPAGYRRSNPHGLFVWLGGCDVPAAWIEAL